MFLYNLYTTLLIITTFIGSIDVIIHCTNETLYKLDQMDLNYTEIYNNFYNKLKLKLIQLCKKNKINKLNKINKFLINEESSDEDDDIIEPIETIKTIKTIKTINKQHSNCGKRFSRRLRNIKPQYSGL